LWYTRGMKKVSEAHHLQKRGNVWHYYRRVPKAFVSAIGKTFIKQSLKTQDLKTARILRNALNVKFDAELSAVESAANTPLTPVKPISPSAFTESLRQHIEALNKRSADRSISNPPESESEKSEMIADIEVGLGILRNRDDPRGDQWISSAYDKVLNGSDIPLSDQQFVTGFAEMVRRGLVEVQYRKLDRLEDRNDGRHHDALFDPTRSPVVTFGELAEIYWAEQMAEYEANGISAKRSDKVKSELAFAREAIGEERLLEHVTDDVVQAFRKTLDQTPANRKKLYPKLPLEQALKRAVTDGKRVLSPTTQAQYLRTLRDVLAVGLRKGLLRNNPAVGVKPLKKDKTAAADKRLPWTDVQIKGFFTGAFYQSCAPGAVFPYTKKDQGWRFWLPLLMVLMGARPNEICQLHTADLKQTTAGTLYLDLLETEDDDGKTLKSGASRRRVPLHPEIVKIV